MTSAPENIALHFDLSHCQINREFTLHAAGKTYPLTRHTPKSIALHSQRNRALRLIPEEQWQYITHYIEDVETPDNAISLHWISFPANNPADLLPELATVFFYIPEAARRRALRKHLQPGERQIPYTLAHYGVNELPSHADDEHHELHAHAATILPPGAAAKAIVAHHPDVASLKPEVAAYVDHIIDTHMRFDHSLSHYISAHGPDTAEPWYHKGVCEANGKPVTPYESPEIKDKHGKQVRWPIENGQKVIPQFKLSVGVVGDDHTRGAAVSLVQKVVRAVKADRNLKGELWSAQPGVTAQQRGNSNHHAPDLKARRSTRDAMPGETATSYKWTSTWLTTSYGLDFDNGSLHFDAASNRIKFRVKNWANRALSAYVEFADESSAPILDPEGWDNRLPADLQALQSSASKKFLESILSGDTIFGIPIPTDYVSLEFEVPRKATAMRVLFGGLGSGHYDADVDKMGIILTCVLNYGIPSFMMTLSIGLQSTEFYMEMMSDPQMKLALLSVAVPLFAGVVGGAAVEFNTKTVLFRSAEFVGGIIFSYGLRRLAFRISGYVSSQELMENIPFVGWALRIASCAAAMADMIRTSVDVCLSPATFSLQIKRSIDVHVTIKPDPIHGTATQPPIWPAVAHHYLIRISYRRGNRYQMTGRIPAQQDEPLSPVWEDLPSGPDEAIQITTILYSKNDWIAGQWVSAWIPAVPNDGSNLNIEGSIIESLVPLDQNTEYSHNRKLLTGSSSQHEWALAAAPTATVHDRHCTDDGHNLCELTGLTLNNRAYALGYTWRASGQNLPLDHGSEPINVQMYAFQSISVLADPTREMKAPRRGFGRPAYLLYDQFGPRPLLSMGKEYQTELDAGTISQRLRDLFSTSGEQYNLPQDAMVTVAGNSGTEWTIGQPALPPLYGLQLISHDGHSTIHVLDYAGGRFLFSLPSRYQQQLMVGPVSNEVRAAFSSANVNLSLPPDATITVHQLTAEWYIGTPGAQLYDLRRNVDSIEVFHYPAPAFSPNNFYLDPRDGSGDKNYHVRHVDLAPDAEFDYGTDTSWGTFVNAKLDAAVVHPSGYIVGVSYDNHKMEILRLPEQPVPAKEAQPASLVSGLGVREGLMHGPVALTVTPDGRILVLERDNARIQAFDIAGNAVQCFAGPLSITLDPGLSGFLDQNNGSALSLQAAYQLSVPAQTASMFVLTADSVASLDAGGMSSAVRQQFAQHGLSVANDNFEINVTNQGSLWLAKNTTKNILFDIRRNNSGDELEVFQAPTLHIEVKIPGHSWILRDKLSATVFEIDINENRLRLRQLIATMPLHDPPESNITYLDIGVETKSFIYVLSYAGTGSRLSDYHLDLYNPDGTHLSRTPKDPNAPGVNAAKLAIDQWRSVYTLNFEQILGPGGQTEPSISRWIPSTPQGQAE